MNVGHSISSARTGRPPPCGWDSRRRRSTTATSSTSSNDRAREKALSEVEPAKAVNRHGLHSIYEYTHTMCGTELGTRSFE
jgi:hypothetical protein